MVVLPRFGWVKAIAIVIIPIIVITINLRYTDGSVAQGWVKEGAWHGAYRSG